MATQTVTATGAPPATELNDLAPAQSTNKASSFNGKMLGSTPSTQERLQQHDNKSVSKLSKSLSVAIIIQLCFGTFISSFVTGYITINLPAMAASINLSDNLLLWPQAVYSLTSGSCMLLTGSLTDVLGAKRMNQAGNLLAMCFILGCGRASDGIQLILFRVFQGIALAMTGPSAFSILSKSLERGRLRNIAFASYFLGFIFGYSLGLVLGGVILSTTNWRVGFYAAAATMVPVVLFGAWILPPDQPLQSVKYIWAELLNRIDWFGALLITSCLSIFSYVMSVLGADSSNIQHSTTIGLLTFSLALMPASILWMRNREKQQKPALVPISIWKSTNFTSICFMIMLSNAALECFGIYSSLYFQNVQHSSALQASLHILPQTVTATLLNIASGVFVHKMPVRVAILTSTAICAISPLLMAITNPAWSFWYSIFWAQLLAPVSIDILFTIGSLVVADALPSEKQGLASGVFRTFSNLGSSLGLCVTSVITQSVAADTVEHPGGRDPPEALLRGYRASFWTLFAWLVTACLIGAVGLQRVGRVGTKRE